MKLTIDTTTSSSVTVTLVKSDELPHSKLNGISQRIRSFIVHPRTKLRGIHIQNKEVACVKAENKLGSQVILLLVEDVLKKQHLSLPDITEIMVENIAGSYTGTRVGVAIANALGYVLQVPVNGKMVNEHVVVPVYEM